LLKKILVVDDSEMIRVQVSDVLREAGFEPLEAASGTEGISALTNAPETALIICDLIMPGMNGLEMIEALKRAGSHPPILMLTSDAQPEIIQRARDAGARGWIVKPFRPGPLLAAVTKLAGAP
jgi:two-component system, chemotaxis family, chemotaxis protein CheY